MRTMVHLRLPGEESRALVVEGDRFGAADVVADRELNSRSWYALPGLADCHAHLAAPDLNHLLETATDPQVIVDSAWAQVEGGVFLVIDKGGRDDLVMRVLDRPPGRRPHLEAAGHLIATRGGYYEGFAEEVDEKDLPDAVRRAASGNAAWVKLIGDWPRPGQGALPNFTYEGLSKAVDIAHAAGCRVAIHAAAPDTSSMAVAAGIDSIEHGLFLTAADVAALGQRSGAWVPTIAAMEGIRAMLGAESSGGRLFARGLANVRELLPGAVEAGVVVLAGTDLILAHGGVAAEAERLVEYGLTPSDAVDALSTAAYDYLGVGWAFEPGAPADAVFFDGDPREDVSVLRHPVAVIRRGELIKYEPGWC